MSDWRIERLENFTSAFVSPRHVDVFLPSAYAQEADPKLPVIYMHDGQNLFDPQTAFANQHWGIAEVIEALAAERRISPAIIVGIWHSDQRGREYLPKAAAPGQAAAEPDTDAGPTFESNAAADAYLRFCLEELKPHVDAKYRVRSEPSATFMMGSSRGALISLYAVCEHPGVFGGAACLSTHWPAQGGVTLDYFKRALPPAGSHRFYFDFGSETLDSRYGPYQKRMDRIMAAAGYRDGADWVTRYYPDADHSERAWRERLHVPLEFLLGNPE